MGDYLRRVDRDGHRQRAFLSASSDNNNQLSGVSIGVDALSNVSLLDLSATVLMPLDQRSSLVAGSKLTIGSFAALGLGQSQTVDNVAFTLGN